MVNEWNMRGMKDDEYEILKGVGTSKVGNFDRFDQDSVGR